MNSIELAYKLGRISMDSSSSDSSSFSSPQEMLSASASMMSDEFDFDCSSFDIFAPSPSLASSFGSLASAQQHTTRQAMINQDWGSDSAMARSRCVNNLSTLGSASSSSDSLGSTYQTPSSCASTGPNAWGYYVDTPAR